MKEIQVEEKKLITKYETSDGSIFENKSKAECYEKSLEYRKIVNKLKYIDGVYYCATQEDFDAIIDFKAYKNLLYSYKDKGYIPSYDFSKKDFKGADWYFFNYEYNDDGADDYWVETLSDKKEKWDYFYNQFMEETNEKDNM